MARGNRIKQVIRIIHNNITRSGSLEIVFATKITCLAVSDPASMTLCEEQVFIDNNIQAVLFEIIVLKISPFYAKSILFAHKSLAILAVGKTRV